MKNLRIQAIVNSSDGQDDVRTTVSLAIRVENLLERVQENYRGTAMEGIKIGYLADYNPFAFSPIGYLLDCESGKRLAEFRVSIDQGRIAFSVFTDHENHVNCWNSLFLAVRTAKKMFSKHNTRTVLVD